MSFHFHVNIFTTSKLILRVVFWWGQGRHWLNATLIKITAVTGNPFPSPVQFSEENDYITVTAINTEGRRARVSQHLTLAC